MDVMLGMRWRGPFRGRSTLAATPADFLRVGADGGAAIASRAMTAPADAAFLAACRSRPTTHTPVWFMRQAGRSLPEYRAVRGEGSILDAIKRPELATEITLQPVRRYGVDAAVLYSDIVVPAHAIGFGVDVAPGTGPVVSEPFRRRSDLARLRPLEPEVDTPYVLETVRLVTKELAVPLIGFAGAPFTVASYLIEGRPVPHLRPDQGPHVRRRSPLARPARTAGRPGCGFPAQPGGQRRAGHPAVRLLGRCARPGGLPALRAPPQPPGVRRPGRSRRCRRSTSAWTRASCSGC